MKRNTLPAVLLLLLMTPAAFAQEEAPSALFIDRVDVNVINVEVFVTDRDGNRVTGLGRDDFEVYEDGQPVEISNFYASVREDRLLEELERDRAMVQSRAPSARREVPEDQRLHLLVYVDHFNLDPRNRKRVMEALPGFLEDRVIQGDRIMLVGHDRTLDVVQPFTENRQRIFDGLEQLGKVATHRQMDDAERRRVLRLMNSAAAEGELATAYGHIRTYVESAKNDLRLSMAALEHMVRSLAGLPGRKAVLYVSDGLPKRPGEELYQHLFDLFGKRSLRALSEQVNFVDPSLEALREDETQLFNDVVRQANAHEVTFYALDARGPNGDSTLSAEHTDLSAGGGGHTALDAMRTHNLQEPLVEMAEATGGASIVNTFNFAGAFTGIADDFDSFYSLGYRSPRGGDGAYHKIDVRLRNPQPGHKVRHRTGFVDKPPEERVADRTLSSLLLDLGKNPLGVTVEFGQPEKEGRNRYLLPVLIRVPIREISLLPSVGAEEGRLRFYLVVRDEEGGISDLHSQPYPVSIPREMVAAAREREIGYAVQLKVRSGVPKVAVGVWDELSGNESFVFQQVPVGGK